VFALTSSTAMWYLTRGSGLVSLVMLTAVVVLGIAQVQRWMAEGWPRLIVAGLHKNLSLLVLVFLGLHIATAVLDGFAPIHWISTVVPFTSTYRPLWLGLGAVAVDLLIALIVSSLLRQHLKLSTWRLVHWSAYACWPIAFLHGLGTGSDGRVSWVLMLDLVCLLAVVTAVGWRLIVGWRGQPTGRAIGALATMLSVVLIVGWAYAGPTQRGWARKAGTPARLLGSTTTTGDATGSGSDPGAGESSAPTTLSIPLTASMTGTLTQEAGQGQDAVVTIDGTLTGDQPGAIHIVLEGTALADGGLRMTKSSVTLGTGSDPGQFSGQIERLQGTNVTALVKDAKGAQVTIDVRLQMDQAGTNVTGTVKAQPGNTVAAGQGGD
jgi:sulfoxide reductase heme-binding subunit YedZ